MLKFLKVTRCDSWSNRGTGTKIYLNVLGITMIREATDFDRDAFRKATGEEWKLPYTIIECNNTVYAVVDKLEEIFRILKM